MKAYHKPYDVKQIVMRLKISVEILNTKYNDPSRLIVCGQTQRGMAKLIGAFCKHYVLVSPNITASLAPLWKQHGTSFNNITFKFQAIDIIHKLFKEVVENIPCTVWCCLKLWEFSDFLLTFILNNWLHQMFSLPVASTHNKKYIYNICLIFQVRMYCV